MSDVTQNPMDRLPWLICAIRVGLLLAWACTTGCISNWPKKPNWLQRDASAMAPFPRESREFETGDEPAELVWKESWLQAQAESQATGKPILAEFTGSDWCSWCTKLEQDVFETPEFRSWAAENVVLLELDFPRSAPQSDQIREQNRELQTRYGVKGFPTVLLLSSDGEVLGRMKYMPDAGNWIALADSKLRSAAPPSMAKRNETNVGSDSDSFYR